MKFIFILLLVTNLYSNKLGTDEDGVDFYCIDDYVYAHIEGNGGRLLIPVVYKLSDSIIKLPCIEYSKWVKEMYKG